MGTNFTNDVGLKPMNIVIKMTEALPDFEPWTRVVKLSDEPIKHTVDERAIAFWQRPFYKQTYSQFYNS